MQRQPEARARSWPRDRVDSGSRCRPEPEQSHLGKMPLDWLDNIFLLGDLTRPETHDWRMWFWLLAFKV